MFQELPCISCQKFRVLGKGTGYQEIAERNYPNVDAIYFCRGRANGFESLGLLPKESILLMRARRDGEMAEILTGFGRQVVESGCGDKE